MTDLAGVVMIATLCRVPAWPFALARRGEGSRLGGLPGLFCGFAAVAIPVSVANRWSVNRHSGVAAVAVMAPFGAALLSRGFAAGLQQANRTALAIGRTAAGTVLIGVLTGWVRTACAGPMLSVILTGAAQRGTILSSSPQLLAYGLAAAVFLRRRLTDDEKSERRALRATFPTEAGLRAMEPHEAC